MLGKTCSCSSTCFTIIDYLEDSEGYLFNLRTVVTLHDFDIMYIRCWCEWLHVRMRHVWTKDLRVGWNQLSSIYSHECSTGSHIKAAQQIPRNIHWPVSFMTMCCKGTQNLSCDVDLFRLKILSYKAYFMLLNKETHKDKTVVCGCNEDLCLKSTFHGMVGDQLIEELLWMLWLGIIPCLVTECYWVSSYSPGEVNICSQNSSRNVGNVCSNGQEKLDFAKLLSSHSVIWHLKCRAWFSMSNVWIISMILAYKSNWNHWLS